jgi:hypothetical protein
MEMVLLTALGVGGATLIGTLLGFVFKKISHRFSDLVLSFAAGVMLSAAVIGLILPSLEGEGAFAPVVTVAGVFCGALMLNVIDRLVPHLHRMAGADQESHPQGSERMSKVLLFVMAIAIHNLPEGIAAGVGFGSGNTAEALTIAGEKVYTITPNGDYSFFYIEWDTGYSSYWDSIKVYYEVEADVTPDEPSVPSEPNQPTGDLPIAGLVIALTAATGAAIVLTKKKEF